MTLRRAVPIALVALLLADGAAAAAEDVRVEEIARDLSFPTNLAVAPDGTIFFAEKDTGRIRILRDGRVLPAPFAQIDVIPGRELGLLGIALHPRFPTESWVYVYYSDPADGMNTLGRIRARGDTGGRVEPLLDTVTATAGYHNGGDLAFGPDAMLYVSVGEAHDPARAQDPTDLGGKILRLTPEGRPPDDNPFAGSSVYSLGHRNSFGLCVDPETGTVWETENGPDRDDEVNRIVPGGNYGWPNVLGRGGEPRYVDPELVFRDVIVPTGCAFLDGRRMLFGDFGGRLHLAMLSRGGERVVSDRVVADVGAGITDVVSSGRSGAVYVATVDAIWLVRFPAASPPPTPTSSPSPVSEPTAEGSPSPEGDAQPPPGGPTPLALALAAVIVTIAAFLLTLRRRS